MKITKAQLKQIIKEEMGRMLKENNSALPTEPRDITTSDGKVQKLVITDLEAGFHNDPAWGKLYYTIDGRDFEWEFDSGYHPEGATDSILTKLDDEENDALYEELENWLGGLDLSSEVAAQAQMVRPLYEFPEYHSGNKRGLK
jgi:hypothetical protein